MYLRLIDFVGRNREVEFEEVLHLADVRESGRERLRDDRLDDLLLPIGTVVNLKTTTSQKCESVPRRARM